MTISERESRLRQFMSGTLVDTQKPPEPKPQRPLRLTKKEKVQNWANLQARRQRERN